MVILSRPSRRGLYLWTQGDANYSWLIFMIWYYLNAWLYLISYILLYFIISLFEWVSRVEYQERSEISLQSSHKFLQVMHDGEVFYLVWPRWCYPESKVRVLFPPPTVGTRRNTFFEKVKKWKYVFLFFSLLGVIDLYLYPIDLLTYVLRTSRNNWGVIENKNLCGGLRNMAVLEQVKKLLLIIH